MADVAATVSEAVTAGPKAVFNFAKHKTLAFIVVGLVVIVLLYRFKDKIAGGLVKIPLVGKWLAKAMGMAAPAAALLYLTLHSADAHAAVGAVAVAGGIGLVAKILGALGALALGTGFAFPKEYPLDLKTDGGDTSVAITPGAAQVQKTFKISSLKGSFNGAWVKVSTLNIRQAIVCDQAASGGSVVNWDQLARITAGVEIASPTFGTVLNRESGSGPLLKHIQEFVAGGYRYDEGARAQIPATDGDTTVQVYTSFYFAPRCFVRPTDFLGWIGWWDQTAINHFTDVSTILDPVSTGMVTKATSNLQMSLATVLDNDLEVPLLPHWKRFQFAATSNSIRVQNAGAAEGLNGVQEYIRFAGLYEPFNLLGMGGCTTSDNITQLVLPIFGIDRLVNIDMIVRDYLRIIGSNRGPKGGVGASTPLHDNAGNPFTMAATPNGALNDANLTYLPLQTPARFQEITKLLKWRGDFEITQQYTTTPTTGNHVPYIFGVREFTDAMRAELMARANRAGAKVTVPLADGTKVGAGKDMNIGGRGSTLPRKITS